MAVKTFTNEQLTASDTNTYLANSGLVYITSATIGSAVTQVTVSNCFSSTYDNYKIIISGGTSSAGGDLKLTLGSTATGYYYALIYNTYNTPANVIGIGAQNATSIPLAGVATTNSLTMDCDVYMPYATTRSHFRNPYMSTNVAGASGNLTGFLDNATSYTAFTVTITGGTMTGGTITVYGYRKA